MEEKKRKFENKEIIEKLYDAQAETIDSIMKKIDKDIKDQLETVEIFNIVENTNDSQELKEIFYKIEDNDHKKMVAYNKEMYKQGFVDGVRLMLECLKN